MFLSKAKANISNHKINFTNLYLPQPHQEYANNTEPHLFITPIQYNIQNQNDRDLHLRSIFKKKLPPSGSCQ